MARKKNEISAEQLEDLLQRIDELGWDVEQACDAIDNHIPDAKVTDMQMSMCAWASIHLTKFAMRLRTIQRQAEIDRSIKRASAGND
jgi:hypothetical protein